RRLRAPVRWWVREIADGFKRNDLLTYASAISFQILTAVIPFLLFALALAGVFHLNEVWRDHVEPQLRANFSPGLFAVLRSALVADHRPAVAGGGLARAPCARGSPDGPVGHPGGGDRDRGLGAGVAALLHLSARHRLL